MPSTSEKLWVGKWHDARTVVHDASFQPKNADLAFLYFVEGKQLCARQKADDRPHLKTVKEDFFATAACRQYLHWRSLQNEPDLQVRRDTVGSVEKPPFPRRKCTTCDGIGTWHYQVGTFSDGGHSDGQQIIEHCPECRGDGFIDDIYEL
jgi:hypothetical protein